MAKMRMPQMNILRFAESDVIVASGALQIYGFTERGTGGMTWNNVPYDSTNYNDLIANLKDDHYNDYVVLDPGDQIPIVDIGGMFIINQYDDPDWQSASTATGVYYWNPNAWGGLGAWEYSGQ